MNILITEPKDYSSRALAVYKKLGRVYLWSEKGRPSPAVFRKINVLVIGLKYQIDKTFIDSMPALQVIASPATGMNHIDVEYVRRKKIKLISLRGRKGFLRNVPSTAEETFALILALVRRIPWSFDDVKRGRWDRIEWRGHQLMGKTIGLLGFGRLGRIVARYAKAFEMKVLAYDPYVSEKFMKSRGVLKSSMADVFKKSDIVSLHVLLTDETHDLVKSSQLRSMKPTAYLINTARAELIEQGVLEKALKRNRLAGAAVDVMWDERSDGRHLENNPLVDYAKKNKNLIIVPHIGGATYEAMEITQEYIAGLVFKHFKK